MKNHLFLFLSICLGIGICIAKLLILGTNLRIYLILTFFTLFIGLLINKHFIKIITIGLQTIIAGIVLYQSNHLINYDFYKSPEKNKIAVLKVIENYNPNQKYLKFKTQNIVNQQFAITYIPKSNLSIYPTDTIIVFGNIQPLTKPLNPNQFDYKSFLNSKKINHSVYVQNVLKVYNSENNWRKQIAKSKEKIRLILARDGYHQNTRAIISSMLLGDKTELTDEINQSYISSGVIHILSISGLHVVMIFIVLQFIFKPLLILKNGRQFRIIICLITIWLFAVYVDLHPPIFRAVLMITIYYLSDLLKRPKNIYHTLSLTAFIILIFQPDNLFNVGFQLSFAAVFFIVWLNPIFEKWHKPKHQLTNFFYQLSATSISAQLGTLPFSAYYFNQFSTLFLFGNIVLIPASFIMISGGMIAIILSILNINLPIYVTLYNEFIAACNSYLKWLAHFNFAIFNQIYISSLTAVLILIILVLLHPLVLRKSKPALVGILVCLIVIQINRTIDIYRIKHSTELIVFNQYRNSLVGVREGQKVYFFGTEIKDSSQSFSFITKPYLTRNRIKNAYYFPIDTAFTTNDFIKTKHLIGLKNNTIFIGENLTEIPENLDYIVVRNSSFRPSNLSHLNQLKRVIADGSNYPNYIIELDSVFKNKSDSILWKTSQQGYFKIKF